MLNNKFTHTPHMSIALRRSLYPMSCLTVISIYPTRLAVRPYFHAAIIVYTKIYSVCNVTWSSTFWNRHLLSIVLHYPTSLLFNLIELNCVIYIYSLIKDKNFIYSYSQCSDIQLIQHTYIHTCCINFSIIEHTYNLIQKDKKICIVKWCESACRCSNYVLSVIMSFVISGCLTYYTFWNL